MENTSQVEVGKPGCWASGWFSETGRRLNLKVKLGQKTIAKGLFARSNIFGNVEDGDFILEDNPTNVVLESLSLYLMRKQTQLEKREGQTGEQQEIVLKIKQH